MQIASNTFIVVYCEKELHIYIYIFIYTKMKNIKLNYRKITLQLQKIIIPCKL